MIYYKIKGYPDYRLVRDSKRDFHVESKKKGDWERRGCDVGDGHIKVYLSENRNLKETRVHTIVAEMFVPNPEGKTVVHHIDGDAANNDPSNLMWVTPSEHTMIHKKGKKNPNYGKHLSEETRKKMSEAHKRYDTLEYRKKLSEAVKGEKHPNYGKHLSEETRKKIRESQASRKPVEQWSKDGTTLIARYESISEAARQTEIGCANICLCCQGKIKTAGGYIWRYACI